ncbi:GCN5-related N-acetyltransferase [Xylanimonas cellulosilytica DSM 15894]|uniref:GCN5-related N-acetyltransferase n=1 Tax=Xylanimonas cellulosilytica (strain DSM 15894 / JCM 12276 / CECT 5975 / KCTC 9989 / LMG 20990 / NBRC 107835 / XIL07) TaxID=446471 RepID=D1BXZ6_XYLCX|nr:GNAT family N-acetyltransferase [Xylanimonas cellulosilytica]ACZ31787.1 GCN5-related N-acetyltransferase [Xylanimonas cellulosilytica DSM 15894]
MPVIVPAATSEQRVFTPEQPVLSDDVVVLRPWRDDDAAALREAYQDPEIQRWHVRRLETLDEARALVAHWRSGWEARTGAAWAVVGDDGLLGRLDLKGIDLYDGGAEAAYWTVPAARGRGVATAALRLASGWAFDVGFHRLQLEHSLANMGSCRAAMKAGFAVEGTRRSAVKHADGWHDMHVHALIAP